MPRIYVLSGPDVGRTFEVSAGATFGRAPECAVPLRDASVSRHHAELRADGMTWTIADTQSRNGVRVQGERVPAAALADGDEFLLGDVLLRFRSDGPEVALGAKPLERARAPAPDAGREASAVSSVPDVPTVPAARPAVAAGAPHPEAEIVLEGAWDETAIAHQPVRPHEPIAAPRPPAPERTARAQATAKLERAGALPQGGPSARGILQFNKVADRDGFMRSELGQQPVWIRTLVVIAAAALFAGLFWFAFRGTGWLKGAPRPSDTSDEEPESR